MYWMALLASGLMEVVGVMGMEKINRGSKPLGLLLLCAGFGSSLLLISFAMRVIPLGIAYAVFTAIGTVISAILGMTLWNEPRDPARIGWIALIIISVIGLKLVSG
ncbi:DMT family transporter [Kushneria phosphatilytica]|uniref:Guanidinium exporter n=1 Tax=Kushneria phosphatilytica TaxID=657387 RepID=A0A1S1NRD2_9GAMM|nr:multidrug efflux SMR transporter [Kushneria phosphatilytica]OHV07127.1 QacE family quaternary ammonium compound efflux SMR transporter [Kushneria phosphatilytica]QEL10339.1 multidrug efflux SMR transporter [Kushneria phosphatilytica]